MKILVTGAAGFVGSHLCEILATNHEVVGLDNFNNYYNPKLKEINAKALEQSKIKVIRADLAADQLDQVAADCEVIFHLAAQPGISATTPFDDYLKNNIVATHRLVQAATKNKSLKLFANIATSSIYGQIATGTEEAEPMPTSYYGATKLCAEQLALAEFRERGFPACSLRLYSVYGPRERPEKLFPKLIKAILEDKDFPLFEDSAAHVRSFTYVKDAAEGIASVINHIPAAKGEIFHIGSGIEMTTGEAIQIVEKHLGRKARISKTPKRPGDQLKTWANIEKAKKILGYNPRTMPEEGLKAEVEWYAKEIHGRI